MKIGIVCPYDISRGGGVQEHVLAQAAELRNRGHAVKILTPKARNVELIDDKDVISIGNSTKVKTMKTTFEVGVSLSRDAVDDMLAAESFDLLHIHEPEVPVLGAQILSKAICPVIATFHAVYPETPMGRTMETFRIPYARSIFSKLTAMTAVSQAAASFVQERTQQTVVIIPNGIDLNKYKFLPDRPNKRLKTILYIGRLEKRKGVAHLLKAFAVLCKERKDVELVIAGEGDLRDSLEEYVRDNELSRVKFLGYVDEPTKLKLLHSADVFCSPALYGESFGIVLLEAMASGTVVVAGDNAGYSGVMQDTGRLSLVDPKSTDEFARRLALLMDDKELRTAWLAWAKEYVQQFNYPKVVDLYEKLYKKVLSTK